MGGGRGSNVFDLDCSRLCILIDGIQSMLRDGFATCNGGSPHFDPADRIGGGPIVLTVFQLVTLLSAPQAPLPGVVTTYYCSAETCIDNITSSLRR